MIRKIIFHTGWEFVKKRSDYYVLIRTLINGVICWQALLIAQTLLPAQTLLTAQSHTDVKRE
jgi:hypothetical protein